MYFDIDKIQPRVEEYTQCFTSEPEKAKAIFKDIYPDLMNVINGVIFTHKFTRWAQVDDLQSVALEALLKPSGLANFNPNYTGFKGKKENLLFSYISLIAKRSMMYYTMKDRKYRGEQQFEDYDQTTSFDYDNTIIDDLYGYTLNKFKDTRYYNCYIYLIKYLKINGRLDKRDFFNMLMKTLDSEKPFVSYKGKRANLRVTDSCARRLARETVQLFQEYTKDFVEEYNAVLKY